MKIEVMANWLSQLDPNTVTAWPAWVLAMLVCYAFGPRFYFSLTGPAKKMAQGICVFAFFAAARLWFWDVLQHVLRPDWQMSTRADLFASWYNAICNIGWAASFYLILSAIHLQIPEPDRARYWVIFSPFYPNRLRLIARIFGGKLR
jgi:hypothetical protein